MQGGSDTDESRRDGIADWIAWSRQVDPFTGIASSSADQNITYSAGQVPGLQAPRSHQSGWRANKIDATLDSIYRCPEDNLDGRPSHADTSHGYYRYSYAMNSLYAFSKSLTKPQPRVDGLFSGKISSIRKPSEKVLFICEDEKTLDDGSFAPDATSFKNNLRCDLVASRHELQHRRATSLLNPAEGNEESRGNVGFCDGHAEFFSRKDALRARYSGNPVPDPVPY